MPSRGDEDRPEPASDVLAGIRVLDLTRVRAGPTCVRQLADWGADVVKIEAPGVDSPGSLGGERGGPDFQNLHRNKRSAVIDLKSGAGLEVFLRLAESADIVVENYRPDVKDRLHIGYESLSARNAGLVYASISGFGQDGPYRDRPGFDQVAQGMGGLMSITGEPGRGPMRAGIPVADLAAGLLAAQGILLALLERGRSGRGQWVTTSLLQAQVFLLDFQAARWLVDREVPGQAGNDHPTSIPTGVFTTSDGAINIASAGQAMWLRLKALLDDPALDAPEFADPAARSANRAALNEILDTHTRRHPSAEWIGRLNDAGIPCGAINRIDEVFADPQVQHLGMARDVVSTERGPIQLVGQPIGMSRSHSEIRRPPPLLGQHTAEVLAEAGYSDAEIQGLVESGAVGVRARQGDEG
jgi:crotonobetainyl-CoA:carnitine CoA-transferase CaiB-like acyl-CoA transferase